MQSHTARLLGNIFLNFVTNLSFGEASGYSVYDISLFLKRGISNVPFCSIFVPFHFYLVMALVVPALDNIFTVLLISEVVKIGATKPNFLDSGSPRGGGVRACVGKI